ASAASAALASSAINAAAATAPVNFLAVICASLFVVSSASVGWMPEREAALEHRQHPVSGGPDQCGDGDGRPHHVHVHDLALGADAEPHAGGARAEELRHDAAD